MFQPFAFRRHRVTPRLPLFSALLTLGVLGLGGCGGGGSSSSSGNPGGGGGSGGGGGTTTPIVPKGASALFQVDVATGKVTITPAQTQTSKSGITPKTIFSGTAVAFTSSVLLDQPSTLGLKTLSISLTNNWALPIGQAPDGTTTGMKVLVSNLGNAATFIDLRPSTTVTTIAGTGVAGSAGGAASSATFNAPVGAASGGNDTIYIADSVGNRIRKIQNGFVSTLAGSGAAAEANGIGTAAALNSPYQLCVNPVDGALIVADLNGNTIRRITSDGRVSTIAGTGAGTSLDGPGNTATFYSPTGIAVSPTGLIYVSELRGNKIRTITFTGTDRTQPSSYQVSTLAGSGASGSVDAVGTAASFYHPVAIALGADSALYVADQANNKIRRVSTAGEVVTIAGTGAATSLDGTGDVATINSPRGIAVVNGALIVSDNGGNVLRQISLNANGGANPSSANSWLVATLAGTGVGTAVDGLGNVATFNKPQLLGADKSGNIIVPEVDNRIRLVRPNSGNFPIGIPTGSTSTDSVKLSNPDGYIPSASGGAQLPYMAYAGSLAAGATSAVKNWNFVVPAGITAFQFAVTVETDSTALTPPEGAVNAGSPNVIVRTLAGSGHNIGLINGSLNEARFNGPEYIAQDAAGNIYCGDNYNYVIRRIGTNGIVSTVAGNLAGFADGPGNVAQFSSPSSVAVTPDGKTVYVADAGNNRIRMISFLGGDLTNPANWIVSTIAGNGTAGGTYYQTTGDFAALDNPSGLCLSPGGNLYVSEFSGNRIRRVSFLGGNPAVASNWLVALVAGNLSAAVGTPGDTDGPGSAATLRGPYGIACDGTGNIYVADEFNHRIRTISPDGVVTTMAGGVSGDSPSSGYIDALGATARFYSPAGISVDSSGNVYVAEQTTNHIRMISPAGSVTTVAGTGAAGTTDGLGNVATFYNPACVLVSPTGTLYVGSVNDNSIRMIQRIVGQGTQ